MTRLPANEASRVLSRWTDGREPTLLGEGMEGAVYEIDDHRVAKVWFSAATATLQRTSSFYEALGAKQLSFATPRIAGIEVVDGRTVTTERRLTGIGLAELIGGGVMSAADARIVVVDVLAELAGSGPLSAGRDLPVLGESAPFYRSADDFPGALARLVARRHERFHGSLAAAVDGLDRIAAAMPARLHQIDSGRRCVIHGDLTPANIFVDASGRPSAVLDWGFVTSEGDPVFDGAIAASIFTMYGDDALDLELALDGCLERRFGYDRKALLVYRAAYSLVTANAYDPDGADGHFRWCAAALNRPDVVQAVLG